MYKFRTDKVKKQSLSNTRTGNIYFSRTKPAKVEINLNNLGIPSEFEYLKNDINSTKSSVKIEKDIKRKIDLSNSSGSNNIIKNSTNKGIVDKSEILYKRMKVFVIILLFVAVGLNLTLLAVFGNKGVELSSVKKQQEVLRLENEKLRSFMAEAESLENVEKKAQELGLSKAIKFTVLNSGEELETVAQQ